MAIRGSYDRQQIPKGGGGKQLKIEGSPTIKANTIKVPKARPQSMPKVPGGGYFGAGQVF